MINSLRIQEYKCFSDQTLPLRALTLLAGANATGKSTMIQSLLLLRQSHLRSTLAHGGLLLNGPLVNVGTALDAVNETATTDTVAFTLSDNDGREQRFAFDYPRGAGESYILRGVPGVPYHTNHCLFAPRFNYLHAERVGPRVLYPMSEMIEDLIDVGIHGEYTAHCLDRFGSTPIPNPDLVHGEGTSSRLLFDQTRYWMSEIVPDLGIDLKAITEADQMRIGLKTSTGRFLRPTNIGFGIKGDLHVASRRRSTSLSTRFAPDSREPRGTFASGKPVKDWALPGTRRRSWRSGYYRNPQRSCAQWYSPCCSWRCHGT